MLLLERHLAATRQLVPSIDSGQKQNCVKVAYFQSKISTTTLKYSAFIGATRSENSQNICNGILHRPQSTKVVCSAMETDKLQDYRCPRAILLLIL